MRHLALVIGLAACSGGSDAPAPADGFALAGVAQKGPFLAGATVTAYELDDALAQTGRVFQTQTTSRDGSWRIEGVRASGPYVRVAVSGYFLDERTADPSVGPALFAGFARPGETGLSLNVATQLALPRVRALLQDGRDLEEARLQAHTELTEALGLPAPEVPATALDLFGDTPDARVLRTLSLVIWDGVEGNGGALQRTLSEMGQDLADGTLTPAARDEVVAWASAYRARPCREEAHLAALERFSADLDAPVSLASLSSVLDPWVSDCPGGHLDCVGVCRAGGSLSDRVAELEASQTCDPAYLCDAAGLSRDVCVQVDFQSRDPATDALLCGDGFLLPRLGEVLLDLLFGVVEEGRIEGDTPAERRRSLIALMSEALGVQGDEREALQLIAGFTGVQLDSIDEICFSMDDLGDGVCERRLDTDELGRDGGDCGTGFGTARGYPAFCGDGGGGEDTFLPDDEPGVDVPPPDDDPDRPGP